MIAKICSRSYYLTIKSGFLVGISSRAARVFLVIASIRNFLVQFQNGCSCTTFTHTVKFQSICAILMETCYGANKAFCKKKPNKSDCVKVLTNTMHVSPVLENNSEWKGFDNMATNNILVNKLSCLLFPLSAFCCYLLSF